VQASDQTQGIVSIIDLKKLARTMLPVSSTLRDLILSEPDHLQSDEAAIKARLYAKLLYHELK